MSHKLHLYKDMNSMHKNEEVISNYTDLLLIHLKPVHSVQHSDITNLYHLKTSNYRGFCVLNMQSTLNSFLDAGCTPSVHNIDENSWQSITYVTNYISYISCDCEVVHDH